MRDCRVELRTRLNCLDESLETGFGNRFFMTDLLKTLQPKISDVELSMKLRGSEIGL